MRVWIDISDTKHISLYKGVIFELIKRKNKIFITSYDDPEIIQALQNEKIVVNPIEKKISFFGLFEERFTMQRTGALLHYIKPANIDIIFSLGSSELIFSCIRLNIKIATLTDSHNCDKLHWIYYCFNNSYIIVPEGIPIDRLTKRGLNELERIISLPTGFKNDISKFGVNEVKEIADSIELINQKIRKVSI